MKTLLLKRLILFTTFFLIICCGSVPPEVIKTQQKELEIVKSLRSSHIAMIDAFVDQKILIFENFFFNKYGPVYRRNWIKAFNKLEGRNYDPNLDFSTFYNDLVAEYQSELMPIEDIRYNLKTSINQEYDNVIKANITVGRWLDNLQKLNESQQKTIDSFLGSIKSGLSLSSIDETINETIERIKNKL